jgi:hypothetical protein
LQQLPGAFDAGVADFVVGQGHRQLESSRRLHPFTNICRLNSRC